MNRNSLTSPIVSSEINSARWKKATASDRPDIMDDNCPVGTTVSTFHSHYLASKSYNPLRPRWEWEFEWACVTSGAQGYDENQQDLDSCYCCLYFSSLLLFFCISRRFSQSGRYGESFFFPKSFSFAILHLISIFCCYSSLSTYKLYGQLLPL